MNMFGIRSRGRSTLPEGEQQAQDQVRVEAHEQCMQERMNAAYQELLAQVPLEPRRLVSVLVCCPEGVSFNIYRRREVGRYIRNALRDRVEMGIPRANPAFHHHECRVISVIMKDDGEYSPTSKEIQRHLYLRALEAVNMKLVPCHPNHRIDYPFVGDGLMLALIRLPQEARRSSRSLYQPGH